MKRVKISHSVSGSAIQLNINNFGYLIDYYKPILQDFGKRNSEIIAANLDYLLTVPFSTANFKLEYLERPFFEGLINRGLLKDIPRIAEEANRDTKKIIRDFETRNVVFNNKKTEILSINEDNSEENVLLSISFGKDSLLSFGLARELNFNFNLIFFNDMGETDLAEYQHKIALIKDFEKGAKKKVNIVYDHTDVIFSKKNDLIKAFTKTNAMLSYTLELLPIAYKGRSKYLLFGNEQHFNDVFINKDNFTAYASYDQSSEYMGGINKVLRSFGGGFQILSFVEPLYNIAEYKVILKRYPYLIRYIMSCSGNKEDRWCYSCPMCAKNYLYSCAVGIKPQEMGFKNNFFDKRFKKFYPLFSKPIRADEKPREVRDEQLLAFYLAYKNKSNGDLVGLFREEFLREAIEREDELHNKFFRIYNAVSLPSKLKKEVNSIYREELSK